VALLALIGAAGAHVDAGIAKDGGRLVQLIGSAQLEAYRVVGRVALEVHERVVAAVASVVVRAGLDAHELEAEDLLRILVCACEVSCPEPDVANVVKVDHVEAFEEPVGNAENVGNRLTSIK